MKTKKCQKTIVCEGRTFVLDFFDELCFSAALPYVNVYEEVDKTHFFGLLKTKELVKINGGWGMSDRVEWAYRAIKRYLQEEKDYQADWEKVFQFCRKTS